MSKRTIILFIALCLAAPLMFYGCGSDGSAGPAGATGPAGPTGPTGPGGEDLTATPASESCAVCHGDVAGTHRLTVAADGNNVVTGSLVSAAMNGDNTVATIVINVKVEGVNNDAFTTISGAYGYYDNVTSFIRPTVAATDRSITPGAAGSGNYTVTLFGDNVAANRTFMVTLSNGATPALLATVVAHDPSNGGAKLRDVAGNDGCVSCHGTYVFDSGHHGANPTLDACVVCHVRNTSANFVTLLDNGTKVGVPSDLGKRLTLYVHGVHNSHNMPDGKYYRNTSTSEFSVGYPSDMRNCSVCHTGDRQDGLTGVAKAEVSYSLCMSCHVNWDGFVHVHNATNVPPSYKAGDPIFAAGNFHRGADNATDCMQCHGAISTLDEVSDFHNDFQSSDVHYDSFFRGTDISYDNPDNVLFKLGAVTKSGDNVIFTWTASKNGAAVNPCDNNLATGPSFRGLGAYLAYAKGDDWVNEGVGTAPGQPAGARNLFTSLSTTCASNVATTTGLVINPAAKAYAAKTLLAIGGKPVNRGTFTIGTVATPMDYFVRVPSPTLAFVTATGANAEVRRGAVDNAKCNSCHRGTLYQHGGDRVDNEQMCTICHNPSAGEKNVRLGYDIVNPDGTVNTSATYDGKVNETYDMRHMIHAIHGADKRQNPIIIYRTRGIYAFAPVGAAKPAGWPAIESSPQPINGSVTGKTQTHTWTLIHYPRAINECEACHNPTKYEVPDQTLAVALTVDPGTAPFSNQADDIVIGPTAGACTGCHLTAPIIRHTTVDFGYKANVTKEEMLGLAEAGALSISYALP